MCTPSALRPGCWRWRARGTLPLRCSSNLPATCSSSAPRRNRRARAGRCRAWRLRAKRSGSATSLSRITRIRAWAVSTRCGSRRRAGASGRHATSGLPSGRASCITCRRWPSSSPWWATRCSGCCPPGRHWLPSLRRRRATRSTRTGRPLRPWRWRWPRCCWCWRPRWRPATPTIPRGRNACRPSWSACSGPDSRAPWTKRLSPGWARSTERCPTVARPWLFPRSCAWR